MKADRRRWIDFWPLMAGVLLIPIQTDLLIAFSGQWIEQFGLPWWQAVAGVVAAGVGKMYCSYRIWGWVRDLIADTERFQRLADVTKRAARLVWAEGFVDPILAELKLRHEQAHVRGKNILATARWGGSVFLFGAGLHPMWGVRGPLLAVAGITGWKGGFYALALGSAIRTIYLMGGITLLLTAVR
jgi:hypothetical protein